MIPLLASLLIATMVSSFFVFSFVAADDADLPGENPIEGTETSGSAELAVKAPDLTDYESMYENVYREILENKKALDGDERDRMAQLAAGSDVSSIERQIEEKKDKHIQLYEEAAKIEQRNIESYVLDPYTQKIFDDAEQILKTKYMNETGIYDLYTENKYRKIVLLIDPMGLEGKTQEEKDALFEDIAHSVDVHVEIQIAPLTEVHSRSCTSPTSACHPGKGGIQIAHAGSGGGSTLGFKAYHPVHGYGFVIAGHEAKSVGTKIVQPNDGQTYGYVDVMGGRFCDCAFVDFARGHSMQDKIWAPDANTVYPVGTRNIEDTPAGTILLADGVRSALQIGSVIDEGSSYGRVNITSSGGDSGAPLFKPQPDGTAAIYGILTLGAGSTTIYEPYDYIKSDLGLKW
ncbi:MAG: hypothetical protein OXK17_02525 [Thaumarchaeota archaeon]|nr:hypothetical protein [Nitrososphaerota archaeon]